MNSNSKSINSKVIQIRSIGFIGIKPVDVYVQISVIPGLPGFNIVGLPGKVVAESKQRIKCALHNSSIDMPLGSIVVNLTPSDMPKDEGYFDLPIILAIIAFVKSIEIPQNIIAVGDVDLYGNIKNTRGIFAIASYAKVNNLKLIAPLQGMKYINFFDDLMIYPVNSVSQLITSIESINDNFYKSKSTLKNIDISQTEEYINREKARRATIYGQQAGKRAAMISAAGMHNILFSGPPGIGKTMLANMLHAILPDLTNDEISSINTIYSLSSINSLENKMVFIAPFRKPHHCSTMASIVGGGSSVIRPGEISLAHKGILFLDELPEFKSDVIDSLRQPLESSKITISRSKNVVDYPCDFLLVAAMNNCKCGYTGLDQCPNAPICNESYLKKISGPILDRIDIHVGLSNVKSNDSGMPIEEIICLVARARDKQIRRQGIVNGKCDFNKLPINKKNHEFLKMILDKGHISLRSRDKIAKIACTIADLESVELNENHIMESLSYRNRN